MKSYDQSDAKAMETLVYWEVYIYNIQCSQCRLIRLLLFDVEAQILEDKIFLCDRRVDLSGA